MTVTGKLIESEEQHDEGTDSEKSTSSKPQKVECKDAEGATVTFVKQISTGDIVVKRNFSDSPETFHLRKAIRLSSDAENRSMIHVKPEFIKKNDNDNQILIKLHPSELVKDIQNTLIVNKKNLSDKKHGVNNQNSSNINCFRQNVSESDGNSNSFLKTRRVNKLDDVMNDSSKKFKRNEC